MHHVVPAPPHRAPATADGEHLHRRGGGAAVRDVRAERRPAHAAAVGRLLHLRGGRLRDDAAREARGGARRGGRRARAGGGVRGGVAQRRGGVHPTVQGQLRPRAAAPLRRRLAARARDCRQRRCAVPARPRAARAAPRVRSAYGARARALCTRPCGRPLCMCPCPSDLLRRTTHVAGSQGTPANKLVVMLWRAGGWRERAQRAHAVGQGGARGYARQARPHPVADGHARVRRAPQGQPAVGVRGDV
eukprot:5737371-Prymnesium_polylepis.1